MVRGSVISSGLRELHQIRYFDIGKLDPLYGIAIADIAITQISLVIVVTYAVGAAEDVVDAFFVIDTGGNIGVIPDSVTFCRG